MNVEGAIEDDISIENFAQGLGEVPQLVPVLELKSCLVGRVRGSRPGGAGRSRGK